jgi:outer membrane protein OmpA-like peptidoglycan-associated protein
MSYKKNALMMGVMIAGAMSLSACATKKFVRNSVAPVSAEVGQHTTQLGELDRTSREALERATAAGKLAEGKFMYALVLQDDSVKFGVDKWKLSPESEATLATFAEKLKAENKNVYVEIQGHTDATGAPNYNEHLGEERAEAARSFLNRQGVALNRMAAISYGETAPVAPNNTRDGRAQNRRVVLIVLS